MPSKYTEEQRDALADIQEAGGLFVITHTGEEPDPTQPGRPWRKVTAAPIVATVHGVLTAYKKTSESQGYTAGSEDAKFVLPGDMQLLVAAIEPELLAGALLPMPRDTIIGPDGQQYVIMTRTDVAPDGIPILHKLHVRK